MHKIEYKDYAKVTGGDKEKRRDKVPDKFKMRVAVDYIVKRAFDAWGNKSTNSDEPEHPDDTSMIVVKNDKYVFDSLFSLMDKSEDKTDEEVTYLISKKI